MFILIINYAISHNFSPKYPSSSFVKPGRLIFKLINLLPHLLHLFCHLLKLSIKSKTETLIRKNYISTYLYVMRITVFQQMDLGEKFKKC